MHEEFTNTHPALGDFWHPVALSSSVTGSAPVGVWLAGERWVLARLNGSVAAFRDQCPHRRARLSAGTLVTGTLQCPYHGWRYGADGGCVAIPALEHGAPIPPRARLSAAAGVAEEDGLIWLTPRSPRAGRPSLRVPAALGGAGVATIMLPAMRIDANAAILLDNFLDEAHFPFVHAATIGGAGPEPIGRAAVDRHGLGFTAVRSHTFTNLLDPLVAAGSRGAVQRRRMTFGYQAPLHATLLLEMLDAGDWQYLTFTVQPESASSCVVYQTLTGPGLTDPAAAAAAAEYEMSIFAEDQALQVNAMSGLDFPLDPAAELHTKADRIAVEFRRVLAEAVKAG